MAGINKHEKIAATVYLSLRFDLHENEKVNFEVEAGFYREVRRFCWRMY